VLLRFWSLRQPPRSPLFTGKPTTRHSPIRLRPLAWSNLAQRFQATSVVGDQSPTRDDRISAAARPNTRNAAAVGTLSAGAGCHWRQNSMLSSRRARLGRRRHPSSLDCLALEQDRASPDAVACRSHSSAHVVHERTQATRRSRTVRMSHCPGRERTRAVASQMSAQTRLSATQARSVTTSSSMRSESAQAVQVWTQVKQVSIAAASSSTATGTAAGEAFSIWRVSVMPFRKRPPQRGTTTHPVELIGVSYEASDHDGDRVDHLLI
jgi:hypothetical protein